MLCFGTRRQVESVIVYCLFQCHGSKKKRNICISSSIWQKLMIEALEYFTLIDKLFYQTFYDAQFHLVDIFGKESSVVWHAPTS